MKSYVKTLMLAPVFLLSLTACEAKLSEEKARERAAGYDLAAVQEKYESVTVKGEVKVKKREGVFAEGGIMGSMVDLIVSGFEGDNEPSSVEEGFFTSDTIDEMLSSQEGAEAELSYYAYKKTGLKVVGVAKADSASESASGNGTSKATLYVLDDGRLEKGNGSIEMSFAGGEGTGISMSGALSLTFNLTYTWNAKK